MTARIISSRSLKLSARLTGVIADFPVTPASLRTFHISQPKFQQATPTPPKGARHAENIFKRGNRGTSSPDVNPGGIFGKIAAKMREKLPNTTEPYVAHGVTLELYNECLKPAAYIDGQELSKSAKFWYDVCGRPKTFMSWAQVTVLHMWMIIVRIRAFEPNKVKAWQQHFIDHFFYDAEGRMINTYKIGSASERKTYLKDLYSQYRGMIAGFDEGLCKGDSVLAAAIWRNVFDADPDVNMELLASITSYTRRVLSGLSKLDDEVLYAARVTFGLPEDEAETVRAKSRYAQRLAENADVKTEDA